MERHEKRPIPQMPWPLVQPDPSCVPNPTKIPPTHKAPTGRRLNGSKTKKDCDGFIKGNKVEIKTASIGSNKKTFQYELGENPWEASILILVSIAPKVLYLTIIYNWDENHYCDSLNTEPYFQKKITRRKGNGNFKITLSEKDLVETIENNDTKKECTFLINNNSSVNKIGEFINRRIN